jgi:hypothetical protein
MVLLTFLNAQLSRTTASCTSSAPLIRQVHSGIIRISRHSTVMACVARWSFMIQLTHNTIYMILTMVSNDAIPLENSDAQYIAQLQL